MRKDIINTMDKTNIVYNFFVKTAKRVTLVKQKDLRKHALENILNTKINESVVNQHQISFNHKFIWNNVILESNYKKRLISEMIRIKCHQNSINKKEDI